VLVISKGGCESLRARELMDVFDFTILCLLDGSGCDFLFGQIGRRDFVATICRRLTSSVLLYILCFTIGLEQHDNIHDVPLL
jgi:hypothetical protein